MGGMEMMLKAMGLDPEEFKQFMAGFQSALKKFDADLEQLKRNQDQLEINQRAILAACARVADSLDPNPTGTMPGAENGR